jgi:LPXTG-motif cell wall-anchored protein
LRAAYQKFERDDKILPLPAGYEPRAQVSQNALRRVILPALLWPAVGFAVAASIGWWFARRRKKS